MAKTGGRAAAVDCRRAHQRTVDDEFLSVDRGGTRISVAARESQHTAGARGGQAAAAGYSAGEYCTDVAAGSREGAVILPAGPGDAGRRSDGLAAASQVPGGAGETMYTAVVVGDWFTPSTVPVTAMRSSARRRRTRSPVPGSRRSMCRRGYRVAGRSSSTTCRPPKRAP